MVQTLPATIGKRLVWGLRRLWPWFLFVHFSALGWVATLPLLGAATVSPRLAGYQMLGLVTVAVTFHCFAFVLNDFVDLPVDRTQPRRAEFPLVRGTVRPWQALFFALLQVPLALALTAWLGGGGWAYAALGAGFALMTVYNVWGKRVPFPPLTEVAQGMAWGALALYGALVVSGRPSALTGVVFVFTVVFILMINGVHGNLRDLHNDLKCGVRTMAILLGARPKGSTGLIIPRRLRLYALMLQVILILVTVLPLVYNQLDYGRAAWLVTTGAMLMMAALSLYLMMVAVRSVGDYRDMNASGMLHVLVLSSSPIVLFGFYLDRSLLAVTLAVYILPLLTHSWLYSALQWSWHQGKRRSRAASKREVDH